VAKRTHARVLWRLAATTLLPLTLGVLTYAGRSRRPIAFALAPSVATRLHSVLHPIFARLPPVVVDSLPDVAWAFALASLLAFVWRDTSSRARTAWLAAGAMLAIGYELAQLARWVPGTFDPKDLFASAAGYAAAIVTADHDRRSSMNVRHVLSAVTLALFALLALGSAANPDADAPAAPQPCSARVDPIRSMALLVVIDINYTFTPKDESGGRTTGRELVLLELNNQGSADGNTFAEPNGQQSNLSMTFTINNDGQDHYTGTVSLDGWGQGHIVNVNKTENTYADPAALLKDLTDGAYDFIRRGWHDPRPECPQN